ncbi:MULTISPECIES: hypothetical protein [Metabacillus]|uniref:Uncharacterized protein n=1 Tax=Metabacillus indicus TaxID=246786 RepID=A0A084H421_METID|nr:MULTISPECIES: hypothetical protein [Metabacillus]KEZ50174.1 hypothetical protein AZ46_0205565 [Metabacillus indicus LMG 22858]KEZ54333.1 hypothetical protein GS18_0205250 [Metabacillus indicus]MDX8288450.1 hypothetical protein [Metabacillus indicus]
MINRKTTDLFVKMLLDKYGLETKLKAIPEDKKKPLRDMVTELNSQVEDFLSNLKSKTEKGGK